MGAAACEHHQHRQAIGICVRCRRAMCDECITKIDGINHCKRCLDQLVDSTRAAPLPSVTRWSKLGLWSSWLTLWLMAWWMMSRLFAGAPAW